MRILMIAPEPFFEPRGTPFSEYHRIRALLDLGHTVDLVTYPFGKDVTLPGLRIFRAARPPFSPRENRTVGAKVFRDRRSLSRSRATATMPSTLTRKAAIGVVSPRFGSAPLRHALQPSAAAQNFAFSVACDGSSP
jgi:hypothetical protein